MNTETVKSAAAEVAAATTPPEAVAHAITIAALAGLLPSIATVLSIILISLKIWETDTVRRITRRSKQETDGGE